MLFGLMLVAAIVGGYSARFIHLPRVVGFVLGGVVLRIVLYTVIDPVEGDVEENDLSLDDDEDVGDESDEAVD